MKFQIDPNKDKSELFIDLEKYIEDLELMIADTDKHRPCGGWIHLDDSSTDKFLEIYFPELDKTELYRYGNKLRPKFLLVKPGEKLSWQYHERRAEIWKLDVGTVGVMTNRDNTLPKTHETFTAGELIRLKNGIRHRLIGLSEWALVAEIWQHTDPDHPSEESDIIRLEDDYGRN